jgi:hypothetical protein
MDDNKRDEIKDKIHQARDELSGDEATGEAADLQSSPAGKRGPGVRRTAGDE